MSNFFFPRRQRCCCCFWRCMSSWWCAMPCHAATIAPFAIIRPPQLLANISCVPAPTTSKQHTQKFLVQRATPFLQHFFTSVTTAWLVCTLLSLRTVIFCGVLWSSLTRWKWHLKRCRSWVWNLTVLVSGVTRSSILTTIYIEWDKPWERVGFTYAAQGIFPHFCAMLRVWN